MEVSGPRKRKPLRTKQPSSHEKDDIIAAGPAEMSFEEQRLQCEREGSVNRSQATYDQENLIDPDDSDDCTDDDSEPIPETERSATPVSRGDLQNTSNSSRITPCENMPVKRRRSSILRTLGHDSDLYTEDMDIIPEKERTYFQADTRVDMVNTKSKPSPTCDHFHTLAERYKTFDENLWDLLDVNVRRATADYQTREPGTFLFLHYGPTIMLDGFIDSVINITAGCFGGTKPISLDGKYFKRPDIEKDYGVFLAEQKEALRQHGVLVVRNFQEVPAWAAQAFHTICDTQEPLVDRAVIYLTLDMLKAGDLLQPSKRSAVEEAENLLHELWKNTLEPAVLQPLITRVTDNVYRIV
uniref:Uncharacterized protein n=1 Tax=Anopheles maculatus TaxID=74869 RepID=A0A182T124_9DIPT